MSQRGDACARAASERGLRVCRVVAWVGVALGFALMMPGIFFATTVFLGAHGLAWSERATRAVWYGTGFGINLLTVWKVGVAYEAAREKV